MKPTVYIAGPVSGQPDLNLPAFYKMQEELNALGFNTKNPHEFCLHIRSADPSDPRYYAEGIRQLTYCTDIIFLEGWQYSAGAQVERKVAQLLQLGVHESIDQLKLKYSNIQDPVQSEW